MRRIFSGFLAVGLTAAVMVGMGVSPASAAPGDTWTARTASEPNAWKSVAYGNGVFVATAYVGTNRVMYSPDGVTWTAAAAAGPASTQWLAVTFGNGLFVATADTGAVMTSPNGSTWTLRTGAAAVSWFGVTYGNGLFVATANFGTNRVMTSPDGITWTARTAAEANPWTAVTYGNGVFVAVSFFGTNRVMTSPDGITWTPRAASEASDWKAVTYGGGQFVAVASAGTNRVMTSPDGITWTSRTAAAANQWEGVTYGNGVYVAVSQNGTNRVMTSPDGITWTSKVAPGTAMWQAVAYANGLFVAVADSSDVMTSGSLSTGVVTQPITVNANAGNLVLSCDQAFLTLATAVTTCPTLALPAVGLDGSTKTTSAAMNPVYVADGRGDVTAGWSVSAFMVPTSGRLALVNTNVSADLNLANNRIGAANLSLDSVGCVVLAGAPVAQVATQGPGGSLEIPRGLCSAAAASSGGVFKITGTYNLTVPGSTAAGPYAGTVQYLVV